MLRNFFRLFFQKGLPNTKFSARILFVADADVAQQVERILGKDEVTGSNPVISSKSLENLVFSRLFVLYATFRKHNKRDRA